MSLSLEQRQCHLDLAEPCLEIGARSKENRALLAMHLNTTCHSLGLKTGYLCHACHNGFCSNVKHLYWGTAKENSLDNHRNRPLLAKKIAETIKERYGEDFYKRLGEKTKRSSSYNNLTQTEVSLRIEQLENSGINLQKLGWVKQVSQLWGISHPQARRFLNKYWKGPAPYTRSSKVS